MLEARHGGCATQGREDARGRARKMLEARLDNCVRPGRMLRETKPADMRVKAGHMREARPVKYASQVLVDA
jgi:hypothetical protein